MNNKTQLTRTNKPTRRTSIVLVGGCFDILHYGHINFLENARRLGDWLTVALESDQTVKRLKNENRPIHTQAWRKHMLLSLRCVDEVIELPIMTSDQDYSVFVNKVKPAIIAITEGDPIQDKKQVQAEKIGAKLVVIPKIHTPSTSQLAKLIGLE